MQSLIELNEIQQQTQTIHQEALSHIIATDFNTMISIVDDIKVRESNLDELIADYGVKLDETDRETYEQLLINYEELKKAAVNLVAFSANTKTVEAYACANGDLSKYGNAMLDNIDTITKNTAENASYIEQTMLRFSRQTEQLEKGAIDIADSIRTITAAIEEGVRGINGVTESTQMLVEDMDNITRRMEENQQISAELQNETSIFTTI